MAVGVGKVGAAWMAAAEGADPIEKRGGISPGRHLVINRRGCVERNLCHDPRRTRDKTPLSNLSDGS